MLPDAPDSSLYARAPLITVEAGITLCRTLASAKPNPAPKSITKAAAKLLDVAEAAQNALVTRQKELTKLPDEDARLVDQAGDGSWGALRMRLEAFAMLPVSIPDAQRARELLAALFGIDGLSFLKLTYAEQWAVADSILKRIDDENLGAEIDRLAGADFLAHIREQHAAYGSMVSAMLRRDNSTTVNLNDHVRAMGRAIVDYATRILATVDDEDSQSITQARESLRPLDAYREASARRNQKPTPAADGSAKAPAKGSGS